MMGPQIFQKSRSHHKIPGARIAAWGKFHTGTPQFWSDLETLLLHDSCHLVRANQYTYLYISKGMQ